MRSFVARPVTSAVSMVDRASTAMSVLDSLNLLPLVQKRIRTGATHKVIIQELRMLFPGVRGISVRSLKRFCAAHNLHATSRLSDQILDVIVTFGIGTVSCKY